MNENLQLITTGRFTNLVSSVADHANLKLSDEEMNKIVSDMLLSGEIVVKLSHNKQDADYYFDIGHALRVSALKRATGLLDTTAIAPVV